MTSTDWHGYDVGQLAGIVNEDLSEGWNHVWAWTLATDMLQAARDQLEAARASLAAVWTAEKSPAAQEFFTFVDAVSESMAATAEAATANRTAMQQVLDSQAATQTAVNELHDSWQSWSRDALDRADAQSVMTDLNARAAAHMTAADLVITDATNALVVPSVFSPKLTSDTYQRIPGDDGTSFGADPRHPTGGSPTGTAGARGGLPAPDPIGGSASSPRTGRPGNEPATGESTADPPGRTSQNEGAGSVLDGGVPVSMPPVGGNHQASSTGGLPAADQPDELLRRRLGTPGTTQPSTAGEIGYVDGTPVTPTGPIGTAGLAPPILGAGSAWGGSRSGRRTTHENPWDIPAGVPAILVPAVENDTHDPGPGVIGIDL